MSAITPWTVYVALKGILDTLFKLNIIYDYVITYPINSRIDIAVKQKNNHFYYIPITI